VDERLADTPSPSAGGGANSGVRAVATSGDETPHGSGRRRRMVRRLANLLLVVGGLVLAFPFWSAAYARVAQDRLERRYAEATVSFAAVRRANEQELAALTRPEERLNALAALYGRDLKPGDPLGHLTIPRLHLDRVVIEGAGGREGLSPKSDTDLLRKGPVHYGTTALPGQDGPFAVAGHRTTYGAPFYHLNELRQGDEIVVETPYARLTYRVAKVTTVAPDDVSVLYDRGYDLILTTCTPLYSARRRLIVWATQEGFAFR
jgi:sortase A